MRHMETADTGVDTSCDELPEMAASPDGDVVVELDESVTFGERPEDVFNPIGLKPEEISRLQARVDELTAMSDDELTVSISDAVQTALFFDGEGGSGLFLRSLRNRLSAMTFDPHVIARMHKSGGCDSFPRLREALRWHDVIRLRSRLKSAKFFQGARRRGRRRYVR